MCAFYLFLASPPWKFLANVSTHPQGGGDKITPGSDRKNYQGWHIITSRGGRPYNVMDDASFLLPIEASHRRKATPKMQDVMI